MIHQPSSKVTTFRSSRSGDMLRVYPFIRCMLGARNFLPHSRGLKMPFSEPVFYLEQLSKIPAATSLYERLTAAWRDYKYTILRVLPSGDLSQHFFRGRYWRDAKAINIQDLGRAWPACFCVDGRDEFPYEGGITLNPVPVGKWYDDGPVTWRFSLENLDDPPPASVACTSKPPGSSLDHAVLLAGSDSFDYLISRKHFDAKHRGEYSFGTVTPGTYVFASGTSIEVPNPVPHAAHCDRYEVWAPLCGVKFSDVEASYLSMLAEVGQYFAGKQ